MEEIPLAPSRRRFFLTGALGGAGALLAVLAGWPVWRFLSPRAGADAAENIAFPRNQVAVGQAHFFNFRGRSAVLLHRTPGEFVAFSAICTHLGCIVQWLPEKGEFLCPCHGGRFSAEGRVVAGPPPQPLDRLPVVIDADQVRIG
ncbi:MAG: Rieske (2Fe-2S) protein [Desulfuromonadales bacterium]